MSLQVVLLFIQKAILKNIYQDSCSMEPTLGNDITIADATAIVHFAWQSLNFYPSVQYSSHVTLRKILNPGANSDCSKSSIKVYPACQWLD